MNFTRRETLAVSGATLVATLLPLKLMASTPDLISDITGGVKASSGGIDLTAPEIAENGNTVPISVDAPGAVAITVLAAGNPTPGVAKFNFGMGSGSQSCTTRIRLAGTQDVIAVAEMADGSFSAAHQTVKVTIGGCGG
ncbi:MAG: thiosulfate oxidation carrier protein SoxY [Paracoccaceae bacterium]|jgi:sulfur-oxidizing protein SoxY|nr:thiosulfate oxidation carrier protein SoxY [Paracoccaceae bacterium]MDG1677315.1 thiosulfate oxidation carrier protein SoxY [Paracoccaceae bacterium]|tara:strand:+ start:4289 stop:4705 length:417 start_codon:yes stop_codon:yes gene_type:complete